jgi:hypothetical protein
LGGKNFLPQTQNKDDNENALSITESDPERNWSPYANGQVYHHMVFKKMLNLSLQVNQNNGKFTSNPCTEFWLQLDTGLQRN